MGSLLKKNIFSKTIWRESHALNGIIKIDKSRLRPIDVQTLVCDNNKAKKLLNWSPEFTIEEGLKKTVEWAGKSGIKLNSSFTSFSSLTMINECFLKSGLCAIEA